MSFLSLEFTALALGAVLVLRLLRGAPRALGFLGLNVWFAWSHLGPVGSLSTAAFVALGYGLVVLARRGPAARNLGVALFVAAFVYMRRYSFLEGLLPADLLTDALATIGLSFLLFKILHVVFDVSGGTLERPGFGAYVNYCLNFTTLLMGPIQRFGEFDAQWKGEEPLAPSFEAHLDALNRILRGLVKKFVLAEAVRHLTLLAVADPALLPAGELLSRTYVFYLFLYLDFSGYCDVVIGVGCLMGIRPPENFNLPFLAANVSDFWMRVHRSLTTWLTDYVFNPLLVSCLRSRALGGRPLASTSLALMGTMLVSGLWHGTTLSFLLFGLVHGVYLVGFRVFESVAKARLGARGLRELRARAWMRVASVVLTFNLTALAYLFFVVEPEALVRLFARMAP